MEHNRTPLSTQANIFSFWTIEDGGKATKKLQNLIVLILLTFHFIPPSFNRFNHWILFHFGYLLYASDNWV